MDKSTPIGLLTVGALTVGTDTLALAHNPDREQHDIAVVLTSTGTAVTIQDTVTGNPIEVPVFHVVSVSKLAHASESSAWSKLVHAVDAPFPDRSHAATATSSAAVRTKRASP
jgi:hypothetical protein